MNEKETKWRNVSELEIGEQFSTDSGDVFEVSENKRHDCSDCYFSSDKSDYNCPFKSMVDGEGVLRNIASCEDIDGHINRRYVRVK